MLIKSAIEAETSLKLFEAVVVFCFSFISECATGFMSNLMFSSEKTHSNLVVS